MRVLVARQGYAADQRVVDVGETELVFRLEASALTGRARLAEGVSARRVRVEVRPPGAPVEAHAIASATLRVDGCFEIEELAPGRYELAFLHEHRADPLLMMGPFEIPVADPRFAEELESVDLRHLVRRLSFRVQREDGKPLGFGWLRWGESDPAVPPGITEQIHSGSAQLDTPWPLIDVWVDAPPLRRAELELVSAGCRIDLVSPTGSVLELDRTCELADAELVLYLKKPHLESIRLSFRDSRTRPVTLEAAGSWTLEWWLIGAKTAEEDGTIHYGFSERVPPPAKPFAGRDHLVVAEDQVPQRFVVSPDPCGLAALLEKHR